MFIDHSQKIKEREQNTYQAGVDRRLVSRPRTTTPFLIPARGVNEKASVKVRFCRHVEETTEKYNRNKEGKQLGRTLDPHRRLHKYMDENDVEWLSLLNLFGFISLFI